MDTVEVVFTASAVFLSENNRIYQPRNKNRLIQKFGGNNNENSNYNQYYLCSLILCLVHCRAGRRHPWRMVARRDGYNMFHYLCSITKGGQTMKAYKGFDKNLQCRGFQYEVGKTYTMPEGEDVKLCENGFHACLNVIDCFTYYEPAKSRYCEVELEDVSSEIDIDSKRVARTITIIRELTLDEVHDISSEQQQQQENESGGYESSVRGGYRSSVSGGDMSSVSGGDMSSVSGGDGSSVSGGDWSSVSGGNRSSVRGGYGSSVRGGYGSSVNGGDMSSVRGGDGSSVNGGDMSSVRGGDGSRFKGGKNCVFVAEYYKDYTFVGMRVAIVDGVEFSTDKWYELDDDGNWKEAENQQD